MARLKRRNKYGCTEPHSPPPKVVPLQQSRNYRRNTGLYIHSIHQTSLVFILSSLFLIFAIALEWTEEYPGWKTGASALGQNSLQDDGITVRIRELDCKLWGGGPQANVRLCQRGHYRTRDPYKRVFNCQVSMSLNLL